MTTACQLSLDGHASRARTAAPALPLRPYQREAIDAIDQRELLGVTRQLVVLPTGGGKTLVAAHLIAERQQRAASTGRGSGRALFLAHRDELIQQAVDKFRQVAPGLEVGVVKAERDEVGADVVVASVQTLARPSRLARLEPNFDLVVADESHHAVSPTWVGVLSGLGAMRDDGRGPLLLGITATPERSDRVGLGQVWQEIVYSRSILEMITDGYLVDARGLIVSTPADLARLRISHGDLVDAELGAELVRSGALGSIAEAYATHARDRKGVAFTPTVETAYSLAEALVAEGIPAEGVDGTTPREQRRAILGRLHAGQTQVVCNAQILTEGWDEPSISCVLIARPTKSRPLYIQMSGHGLRIYPGKTDCIAEGQRVLTDRGLIPIERITREMKVWDGVEFVSHCGAISRGEQEVITYAGLTATPDHKVWTPDGWQPFTECAAKGIPIVVTGDGWNTLRETDGHRRDAGHEEWQVVSDGALHDLRQRGPAPVGLPSTGIGGLPVMRTLEARSEVACASLCCSEATLYESQRQIVPTLWGQGDRISVRVTTGDGVMGDGAPGASPGSGARPHRQRWALRTGELALCDRGAKPCQQPQAARQRAVSRLQDETSGGALRGCDPAALPSPGHDADADHRAVAPTFDQAKRRVWDLLNCGPRHRFTVEALLVSNCLILDVAGATARLDLMTVADLAGLSKKEVEGRTIAEAVAAKQAREAKERQSTEALKVATETAAASLFRSKLRWVQAGTDFVLSVDGGMIRLEPEAGSGTWRVRRDLRDDRSVVAEGLSLEYAQGLGEDQVRQLGACTLASADAPWRERPPTDKQRAFLERKRIAIPDGATRGWAADKITALIATSPTRPKNRSERRR